MKIKQKEQKKQKEQIITDIKIGDFAIKSFMLNYWHNHNHGFTDKKGHC